MEVPGASGGLAGTLKEQIKKQRKKIQNQALDDKASRWITSFTSVVDFKQKE